MADHPIMDIRYYRPHLRGYTCRHVEKPWLWYLVQNTNLPEGWYQSHSGGFFLQLGKLRLESVQSTLREGRSNGPDVESTRVREVIPTELVGYEAPETIQPGLCSIVRVTQRKQPTSDGLASLFQYRQEGLRYEVRWKPSPEGMVAVLTQLYQHRSSSHGNLLVPGLWIDPRTNVLWVFVRDLSPTLLEATINTTVWRKLAEGGRCTGVLFNRGYARPAFTINVGQDGELALFGTRVLHDRYGTVRSQDPVWTEVRLDEFPWVMNDEANAPDLTFPQDVREMFALYRSLDREDAASRWRNRILLRLLEDAGIAGKAYYLKNASGAWLPAPAEDGLVRPAIELARQMACETV